jgi:hypothetical protein
MLTAAETLIDGTTAAPSTTRRNRAIIHNAMEYAVELRQLDHNPVEKIKWKAPKTSSEVDRRCVVSPGQARKYSTRYGCRSRAAPGWPRSTR